MEFIIDRDRPLSQQRGLRRQFVKAIRHLFILMHLRNSFKKNYGLELKSLINKLKIVLYEFPIRPETPVVEEDDSVTSLITQWYSKVVSIISSVDIICNDFVPMSIYRSILKTK